MELKRGSVGGWPQKRLTKKKINEGGARPKKSYPRVLLVEPGQGPTHCRTVGKKIS